ncbi:MAG: phosphate ABC transporter substrate-binding protein [Candidatus Poribacteria bacterium]|nr:phosphate ABC transporter substrate-binding protein [Candidatus Poribacteria bacterium]
MFISFGSRSSNFISFLLVLSLFLVSCSKKDESSLSNGSSTKEEKITIQNAGSDTMVNLAQAWAESYASLEQKISVEVSGGGSGTGIAALINGTVDIANCSRSMKPSEIDKAVQNTGKEPKEFIVGFDALAVYVHKENPLEKISLQQLADIYGEQGQMTTWSKLDIQYAACKSDEIIRVSRQSNSGTYVYFREAILGKTGDFKLGSRDLHGSKDVVELVANTPCAIGYSGMGYATDHVKMLKVSKKDGEQAAGPSVENTLNGTYPIARPLYIYSLGEPSGDIKKYLDWILSEAGQSIVSKSGYVPVETK